MKYAILNGELIERPAAKVDIEDRGYQFGDGVYEVIRIYNGKMFTAKQHLDRFYRSAENIGVVIPYSKEQLTDQLNELVKKNELELGIIYMQITRGAAPRNHAFPIGDISPALSAYTKEVGRPEENLVSGVRTILTEDIRWLRCDIKSLNLLGNILAKQKAAEAGCFEALQHRGENMTEGSSSNLFIVKDGTIITHPSNNYILKGITKDVILELCQEHGVAVEERIFTRQELAEADEVFLSSTTAEVMPIIEIDGKTVNGGVPGSVTKQLQQWFTAAIEQECGSFLSQIVE